MNNKTLLRLSLQFFANDGEVTPPQPPAAEDTPTSPAVTNGGPQTADHTEGTEEEFEKLIKGGKFENAFKKRTQGIIDKRFKAFKTLEAAHAAQQPIMDLLAARYGIDSSDTALILKKMQSDNGSTDTERTADLTAEPAPVTTAAEGAKTDKDMNPPNAEKRPDGTRQALISDKANALSRRWVKEGNELKKLFPSFDFPTELKNPAFVTLLKTGMPLRKAYTAVHSDELIKNAVSGTAKRVAEQSLKSIRANGSRVTENGLRGSGGIIRKTDVASLTGKEIRSILKQVENGSKIRF